MRSSVAEPYHLDSQRNSMSSMFVLLRLAGMRNSVAESYHLDSQRNSMPSMFVLLRLAGMRSSVAESYHLDSQRNACYDLLRMAADSQRSIQYGFQ